MAGPDAYAELNTGDVSLRTQGISYGGKLA